MVNCSAIRRQLEATEYELDTLPQEVAAHLEVCDHCRTHAAQMQSLRAMLSEQPRVLPPATFDAELRLRLRQDAHQFREPFLAWVPTPVLATIALVAVVTSALAIRMSMQMVLHPTPTVATALVRPTLPEQTLAVALNNQLSGSFSDSGLTPARTPVAVSRPGRLLPVTTRQKASLPAQGTNDVVLLWRGRFGERVLRLPSVVYGARPILDRRLAAEGESSDDSVF
ncbi:MAG: anti-sigma factor family protein [Acidobacteriota bacterium]